ncbi:MAG: cupin domain-containing protein, partial [Bacillota bacterium]|nr:cupin domain-containing protein [Bacillota bacterium]
MSLSPLRIEIQNIDKKHDIPFDCSLCNIKKELPHKHESELELIYCLKGSVRLIAADQDFTICAGEIHSIDFGDIHYLSSTEDNTTLVFHIDLSFHPEWNIIRHVFFACESLHCYPYQESAMREVKDIILSLSYKYFSESSLDKVHYYPLLCHLVDILFKYFNWYN